MARPRPAPPTGTADPRPDGSAPGPAPAAGRAGAPAEPEPVVGGATARGSRPAASPVSAEAGQPPVAPEAAQPPVAPEAAQPPVARLAANQLRRMRRIVDVAVGLAEQGGFEAVRLRDVAEQSDVALGTLYKYFRSKEDVLLFALDEEVTRLEHALAARPPTGDTPYARAVDFFRRTSRALIGRAALARAMIRALTSADELAVKVAAFQLRIARLVGASLRGEPADLAAPLDASVGTPRERAVAQTLMHVWFSALVGWSAGLHTERSVVEQVRAAAELLLAGEER